MSSLQAAPKAGVDPAPFQSAMDALIRDKNQALDQLDKVGAGPGWCWCWCWAEHQDLGIGACQGCAVGVCAVL